MKWWWIGYTDRSCPKGWQARGCVVIRGLSWNDAVAAARRLGLEPAPRGAQEEFEAMGGYMDPALGDPPPGYASRWLSNREASELAKRWNPNGGVADAADIERAFLDDEAKEGEPLFRRSRT